MILSYPLFKYMKDKKKLSQRSMLYRKQWWFCGGGVEREHRGAREAWRESSSILDLILEQKRRGDLGLW